MPEPPERTALHRLYDLAQGDEIPPFLRELYPPYLPLLRYQGSGQPKCRRVRTGFDYVPSGFEPDCPLEFALKVRFLDPTSAVMTPERTALYRLRAASNQLLYIGISEAPLRRWTEHSKDKPWWPLVTDFALEWHDSRADALKAEAHAIKTERPLHNQVHNRAGATMPRRGVDPVMAERMLKVRQARYPHLKEGA